jgi:transcriptional regulator with XRE-family HTH domain
VVISKAAIGARLKTSRLSQGFTQAKLAKRLGTLQSNISDIERGARKPTLQQLVDIARVLRVSLDQLVTADITAGGNGLLKDHRFLRRLERIDQLSKRDRQSLLNTIDAYLAKV